MRRLCGRLLMATGALDVLYVLVFHSRQLAAIAQDGFFDAIGPNVAYATFDRETAFWHLAFGLMAIILGGLIHWAQARTGTLPAFLGWSLLALSVAALVLMPVSGFWIVLPQAVLMILVSRRGHSRTGSGAKSEGMRRAAG
ncbi:MAG TPA: DUF6463 family protein [Rubrobacter sp.]|jgi:hypothetical protein|nr:DUF6463 family protein [Rubrobacter sp.]